jgi:hypothetical protein
MMQFSVIALLGCTAIVSTGCALQGSAPEPVGVAAEPMVWVNGDSPSAFWDPSNQAALVALGQSSLETAGELSSTPLALTASGQLVLGYVVGCALPAGTSVYSAQAGVSFSGAVGLAPAWASSPLDDSASQRWMTACLLETLNGLGVHVPIRLSGANPALPDQPGDGSSAFTVADSTAFGNLFLASGGAAYVCSDIKLLGWGGLLDGCDLQLSLSTLERICGFSPTCGITLLGPCSLSCAAGPDGDTCVDPAGDSYPEAISVTLEQTVALDLYPLCHL